MGRRKKTVCADKYCTQVTYEFYLLAKSLVNATAYPFLERQSFNEPYRGCHGKYFLLKSPESQFNLKYYCPNFIYSETKWRKSKCKRNIEYISVVLCSVSPFTAPL